MPHNILQHILFFFLKKRRRCFVCGEIVEETWVWERYKGPPVTGLSGSNPCKRFAIKSPDANFKKIPIVKYSEAAIHARDEVLSRLSDRIIEEAVNICFQNQRDVVSRDDVIKASLIVLIEKGTKIIQRV